MGIGGRARGRAGRPYWYKPPFTEEQTRHNRSCAPRAIPTQARATRARSSRSRSIAGRGRLYVYACMMLDD